jgi:23S rRNA pseudouridine1911/1915/1917 synthase
MSEDDRPPHVVTGQSAGDRLDVFLAAELKVPRNRVQRWIRQGFVSVEGAPSKPSRVLTEGEVVLCTPPPLSDSRVAPESGELSVLFDDDDVVVVDKPSGLAMHPGAGRPDGTLVNRLVERFPEMLGVGGEGRPGIVHRLDINTTGVVLVARSDSAYRVLSTAFAERTIQKTYLAVCFGGIKPPVGILDAPIGRHHSRRTEMTVRADGRPARTDYTTLESVSGTSLLRLGLMTGRTHQIRVHLKNAGHPLVGDPVYGEARWKALPPGVRPLLRDFGRPALHAWRIAFSHPISGVPMSFAAPLPEDIRELWVALGGNPPADE